MEKRYSKLSLLKLNKFAVSVVFYGFFGIALVGCGHLLVNYQGAKIRDGYQIPLATGTKKIAQYTTRDLTVDYEYQLKGDSLKIEGRVRFADYLHRDYSLRYFNLSLVFADGENNIIGHTALTSAGYGGPITFDRTLKLPDQAKTMAFAFTYTGEVMGGGDGGGPWDFWEYPIVK